MRDCEGATVDPCGVSHSQIPLETGVRSSSESSRFGGACETATLALRIPGTLPRPSGWQARKSLRERVIRMAILCRRYCHCSLLHTIDHTSSSAQRAESIGAAGMILWSLEEFILFLPFSQCLQESYGLLGKLRRLSRRARHPVKGGRTDPQERETKPGSAGREPRDAPCHGHVRLRAPIPTPTPKAPTPCLVSEPCTAWDCRTC